MPGDCNYNSLNLSLPFNFFSPLKRNPEQKGDDFFFAQRIWKYTKIFIKRFGTIVPFAIKFFCRKKYLCLFVCHEKKWTFKTFQNTKGYIVSDDYSLSVVINLPIIYLWLTRPSFARVNPWEYRKIYSHPFFYLQVTFVNRFTERNFLLKTFIYYVFCFVGGKKGL